MAKARSVVNRRVFSVVLWCLVMPVAISLSLRGLRLLEVGMPVRISESILFLPAFLYALVSLWPALRDLPRVFRIGGLGVLLEESRDEVAWVEETVSRLRSEIPLTAKEWSLIEFHLSEDVGRMSSKNRYLSILSAVVLFFMYQFLDSDVGGGIAPENGAMGVFMAWVDQFSQWGTQLFAILLFSALFYLSGIQLQKHVIRYQVCVKRLARFEDYES
jgi:hypothetical protein